MEGYSQHIGEVVCRETHMSWVFLVDDKVLKLKKPVRFPYLDFSSVEKRRAACLAELSARARHGQIVDGHGDDVSDQLFTFYRCYRATLRARLAVAHLSNRHREHRPSGHDKGWSISTWPGTMRGVCSGIWVDEDQVKEVDSLR